MAIQKLKLTAQEILKNLFFSNIRITSPEQGARELKDYTQDLEVIHIYIENINPRHFRKKKYFNIRKVEIVSRLDEWVYQNLVTNEEYAQLLNKHRSIQQKLGSDAIDAYILNRYYRPKAIAILRKQHKKFNLPEWSAKRNRLEYHRKTALRLKNGNEFRFDFRNNLETLFVINRHGQKEILGVGGGGGSLQREHFTVLTTTFYLLDAKRGIIPNHLLRYDSSNHFHYCNTFYKPIITFDYGSNYSLDRKMREEVMEYGIDYNDALRVQ